MEKVMCMAVFGALAVAILLQVATAKEHVVGDNIGWTIPPSASAYTKWASGNTFNVGDTLVFKFATGNHNVLEVSKASFEECSTKNPIGKSNTTGPAIIKVESVGDHYYICTIGKHCLGGQKLAISVSATGGSTSNTTADNAPPPRPSSSAAVFASLLLSLSSIALTIFL